MTTISERLRAAPMNRPQIYAEREEAADTIDALVAAVERVLIWVRPIAGDNTDMAAAVEEEDSIAAIDAALALARK